MDDNTLFDDHNQPSDASTAAHRHGYEPPAYIGAAHASKPAWAVTTTQRRLMGGGIGGVVLVMLIACVAIMANAQGQAGTSTTETTTQVSDTATPEPTQVADTTPTINPAIATYSSVVVADTTVLNSDASKIGDDCSSDLSTLDLCKTDLQTFNADAASFQSDLDAHPAPPCLASVDKELRNALTSYQVGSSTAIQGIDDMNGSEITAGAQKIKDGTNHLNTATSLVLQAVC